MSRMNTMISFTTIRSALVLPLALISWGCAPHSIVVHPDQQDAIRVSGQGEVYAAPDLARVRLGVEERAVSAEDAMSRANARMTQITQALQAKGVAGRDLQTTELSMYFERTQDNPQPVYSPRSTKDLGGDATATAPSPQASPEGYYVVRNTLIVSVRKLDQLGTTIGAAMAAGANHLHGLELSLEDPSTLRDEARKKAVAQAVSKAQLLAKEAKVELGPVLSINEAQGGEAVPMMAGTRMKAMADASVPVESGELSLTQQVEVVFAIKH